METTVALTAWNRELGMTQGRIAPRNHVPPEGTYVFVLGCDLPGLTQRFAVGDHVEDAKLVRLRARMRPSAATPAGVAWQASLRIYGEERTNVLLTPGRMRDRLDLVANVSKLVGDHELAFRLELVTA